MDGWVYVCKHPIMFVNIYVDTYMYVCTYVCVYVCISVCESTYILYVVHIDTYMHTKHSGKEKERERERERIWLDQIGTEHNVGAFIIRIARRGIFQPYL